MAAIRKVAHLNSAQEDGEEGRLKFRSRWLVWKIYGYLFLKKIVV